MEPTGISRDDSLRSQGIFALPRSARRVGPRGERICRQQHHHQRSEVRFRRDGRQRLLPGGLERFRQSKPARATVPGDGVFYQRFSFVDGAAKKVGKETRVNQNTAGNQYIASVSSDADGNVVIAYTGVGTTPGTTEVYKASTAIHRVANRQRRPEGYRRAPPAVRRHLVVATRRLHVARRRAGPEDRLRLQREHVPRHRPERQPEHPQYGELEFVPQRQPNRRRRLDVTFAYNPKTRKYECTVTLNGTGLNTGDTSLVRRRLPIDPRGNRRR